MEPEAKLRQLLKEGKITEEDLFEVSVEPKEKKNIADVAHSLFCEKIHAEECHYYEEETMDTCWTEPDHLAWLTKVAELKEALIIETYDELGNRMAQACDLRNKVNGIDLVLALALTSKLGLDGIITLINEGVLGS